MSAQSSQATAAPTALEIRITDAWVELRREIIQREGCAVRAGLDRTIEVQLINSSTGRFLTLTLPNGERCFASVEERDAILARLQAFKADSQNT